MHRLTATAVAILASACISACTSSSPRATAVVQPAKASPTALAAPAPSPSPSLAVIPPLPPDGFSGPGAFVVTWAGTKFVTVACPATHPTATCYSGVADTTLPIIGRVSLARMIAVGDGNEIAPRGCVTAGTDGTVTSGTGAITFHATGLLCGRTSAFTVTASKGAGSMGGYTLQAQIINDSTSETWTGEITPVQ